MKRVIFAVLVSVALLLANQMYYLKSLQFKCTEKIEKKQELNSYEIASALQTHLNMSIVGLFIEPNTAKACMIKQVHINPDSFIGCLLRCKSIPEDDPVINQAKRQLQLNQASNVRLTWKSYDSPVAIYLNGSELSIGADEIGPYYLYTIPLDYKPGIVSIANISISETVFDYLENRGYLTVFTDYYMQSL